MKVFTFRDNGICISYIFYIVYLFLYNFLQACWNIHWLQTNLGSVVIDVKLSVMILQNSLHIMSYVLKTGNSNVPHLPFVVKQQTKTWQKSHQVLALNNPCSYHFFHLFQTSDQNYVNFLFTVFLMMFSLRMLLSSWLFITLNHASSTFTFEILLHNFTKWIWPMWYVLTDTKAHDIECLLSFEPRSSKWKKICAPDKIVFLSKVHADSFSIPFEFFTIGVSVRLSDRFNVTQNKINFVKNCPQWG